MFWVPTAAFKEGYEAQFLKQDPSTLCHVGNRQRGARVRNCASYPSLNYSATPSFGLSKDASRERCTPFSALGLGG